MAQNAIRLPKRNDLTPIGFAVLALALLIGCTAPAQTPTNNYSQTNGTQQGLDTNRVQPAILIVKFSGDYSGDYLGTLSETSGIYTAAFNSQPIPSPSDSNSPRLIKLTNNYYALFAAGGAQSPANPQTNYAIFTPAIIQKITSSTQNQTPAQMLSKTAEFSSNDLAALVVSQSPFLEEYFCKLSFGSPTGPPSQADQNRTPRNRNINPADRNFNLQDRNFHDAGIGMMRDSNILYPISNSLSQGTIPANCQRII